MDFGPYGNAERRTNSTWNFSWKHLYLEIPEDFVVFHIPHRSRTWKCCCCFLLGEGTKNGVPGVKPQIQPPYGGRRMRYPYLPHPLFATPDTIRGMDTSFQRNDFWDRLGVQALVMTGRWYSRQLLTNHK